MTVIISSKKWPKAALRRIEQLEHSVEHWKAKALAASSESADGTNVALLGIIDPDRGLPPDSCVRFTLAGKGVAGLGAKHIDVKVNSVRGELEVRSNDGFLVVKPAASNVVHVVVVDR